MAQNGRYETDAFTPPEPVDPLRSRPFPPPHSGGGTTTTNTSIAPPPPPPSSSAHDRGRSPVSALSSRGPSLDGAASFGSNPFRDPSLRATSSSRDPSLDLSSRDPSFDLSFASIHSRSNSRAGSPSASPPPHASSYPGRNGSSALPSARPRPPPPPAAPLQRTPSEVSRELADAFREDLPRLSEETSPGPGPPGVSPTGATTPRSRGGEAKTGLWSQFRTGSGWFAPLVEPDRPLTREERAAAEKERIERLKEGRASAGARRPGLMKRMSSGFEMGAGRSRSGSQSTLRRQ